MRIIHLSCVSPPEIGGIGVVASTEVAGLSERGIDSHLVSLNSHPSVRIGNVGSFFGLKHFVQDCDIVHLHYPFFGIALQVARLRKKGIIRKFVVTFHMDATAKGWRDVAAYVYRRFFQDKVLDAADVILVSSKDYALSSSAAKWVDKMVEIPFGIDEHIFCPSIDNANKQLNQVLFVGGMDKPHVFKGVDLVLEAMKELPDAKLVLVGDGDMRKDYEKKALKLGISDRVRFAGRVERDDLIRLYQESSVLAFPSTSRAEAFGLVALEAHACGTPVVASELPGVRTVVKDGETGVLISVGDVEGLRRGLQSILENAEKRNQMSVSARKHVLERFSWNKHMDRLMQVYTDICE